MTRYRKFWFGALALIPAIVAAQQFGIPRRVFDLIVTNDLTVNGTFDATVSADDITTGTLADARLSSNVPLLDQANTFTGTVPRMSWFETDAPTDEGRYSIAIQNGGFNFEALTDAGAFGESIMLLTRTGTSVDDLTVMGIDMTPETGTFTIDWPDACTTTPTQTNTYSRIGNTVTLELGTINCTSNSTFFDTNANAIPTALRPSNVQRVFTNGANDGTNAMRCLEIEASGVLELWTDPGCGTGWTNSGTKTLVSHTVTYLLN